VTKNIKISRYFSNLGQVPEKALCNISFSLEFQELNPELHK
jgi:hypothetical protein